MNLGQLDLSSLWPLALKMLVSAAGALVVFLGFCIAAWIVKALVRRIAKAGQPHRRDVVNLLGTVARWTILSFGFVTALGTLGVDITGLIAGLGLTGFALGFALKDLISSTVAGVLIMLSRPFRAGDTVRLPTVAGVEGTVAAIELRYTVIAGAQGLRHLVPNSKVLSELVTIMPAAPRG
jgi:small conductance mechanosensitive channel